MGLTFIKGYRNKEQYRTSFHDLMRKTYGFDLEHWYKQGYWGSRYIPYSFADGDQIVANVSVNLMDLVIEDKTYQAVQLGTVMTDAAYRKRGFSRALMNRVLEDYDGKCDLIYLFANSSVLDFYPKFGFHIAREYQCSAVYHNDGSKESVRRLDLDNPRDKRILTRLLDHVLPSGRIRCKDNKSLIMFYCTYFMKDMVYYLAGMDTAVVAEITNDELHLLEVFSEREYDVRRIVSAFMEKETIKVLFGFTPVSVDDTLGFCVKDDKDDTLFIRTNGSFMMPQAMFPVLSHA